MIRSSLGDTGIAAPLSECTSVVLTDHGLVASHAAGNPCPPVSQPGGNWVQGCEYASSLNQPHTLRRIPAC